MIAYHCESIFKDLYISLFFSSYRLHAMDIFIRTFLPVEQGKGGGGGGKGSQ